MGMLDRYKKQGGFQTLLHLIEGCAPKRQAQLLDLVDREDAVWGNRIKTKMLTMEKVLNMPEEGIADIFSTLPEKILVFALYGMTQHEQEKILKTFSHYKQKGIADSLGGTKPKPAEIESANIAIFKKIRVLDEQGKIKLSKLDPSLNLEDKRAA